MDDIFNNLAIKWDETLLGGRVWRGERGRGWNHEFRPFRYCHPINRQINIARVGIRAIERDRLGRENRVI